MNAISHYLAVLVAGGLAHAALTLPALAQSPSVVPASLTSGRTAGGLGTVATRIRNRSRIYGANTADASGTLYWSADSPALRGVPAAEALQRLSPVLNAADRTDVRRLEVLVDLSQPLTIRVPAGQTASVGTVTLSGISRRRLEVNTWISARSLTVVSK